MHILFLTHYFPPEVNAPANRTYEHAARWVKNGEKVTIITNHPNHPHGEIYEGYKNKWITSEDIDGTNVIRVKTYLTPNKGKIRRILNFLIFMILSVFHSLKVKNVDLVIATSPQFFCGLAGTIVSKFKNCPFVLEIRDLWPDSIVAVGALKENLLIKILRICEKSMYFSASKIITLTDAFKLHIWNLGYNKGNILTIPNSIDLNRANNCKKPVTDFNMENKFICSYIGTFGMAHNLELILNTAKKLLENNEIHFLLIGDGAEKERIIKIREDLKLTNVSILPLQSRKDIPWFYKISNIGLITLKDRKLFKTVIPSKIFEYMLMKRPLIMSMPEGEATRIVIENDCGIYSEPEDSNTLAKNILYLFNNKKITKRLGENGHDLVTKKYNRDTMAARMLEVFKKTC